MCDANMELNTHGIRTSRCLRVKKLVPLVAGKHDDVIRRCLWRGIGRDAYGLEKRVGIWKVHNTIYLHRHRGQTEALYGNRISGSHVEVCGRLLRYQHPLGGPNELAKLGGEQVSILGA
jgi:hypothetical protein